MDYLFGIAEGPYYLYFMNETHTPDTLVSRLDLDGRTGGCLFLFDQQFARASGNINRKNRIMQRIAVFSFIGIVVLLLASTAHESAVRKVPKKPGGLTGTYVSAIPPVQIAGQ